MPYSSHYVVYTFKRDFHLKVIHSSGHCTLCEILFDRTVAILLRIVLLHIKLINP